MSSASKARRRMLITATDLEHQMYVKYRQNIYESHHIFNNKLKFILAGTTFIKQRFSLNLVKRSLTKLIAATVQYIIKC